MLQGRRVAELFKLQREAIEFFKALINNKSPDDYIFTRENGLPWSASYQTRPFKQALERAGLSTDGSIYALRHTYASMAIENGTPLIALRNHLGTSVKMVEKHIAIL